MWQTHAAVRDMTETDAVSNSLFTSEFYNTASQLRPRTEILNPSQENRLASFCPKKRRKTQFKNTLKAEAMSS
jgi:hypothetical protein